MLVDQLERRPAGRCGATRRSWRDRRSWWRCGWRSPPARCRAWPWRPSSTTWARARSISPSPAPRGIRTGRPRRGSWPWRRCSMFEAVHLPAQVGGDAGPALRGLGRFRDATGRARGGHCPRSADPGCGGQLAGPHPEPGQRLRPALHARAGAELHGRASGDAVRPPGGRDARAAPLGRAAPATAGERWAAGPGRRAGARAPRRGGAGPGTEGAGGARDEHPRGGDGGGARVGPLAVLGGARDSGDRPGARWSSARIRGWLAPRCW